MNTIFFSLEQSAKARLSMTRKLSGRTISSSPLHEANAFFPMHSSPFPNWISVSLVQCENASFPIFFNEFGNLTDFISLYWNLFLDTNAAGPIISIPSGMTRFSALSSMSGFNPISFLLFFSTMKISSTISNSASFALFTLFAISSIPFFLFFNTSLICVICRRNKKKPTPQKGGFFQYRTNFCVAKVVIFCYLISREGT